VTSHRPSATAAVGGSSFFSGGVAVVSVGRSPETYVVALKVKAPPPPACTSTTAPLLDPSRLASIDLVTVLDVSGSMTRAKLQMLKRAMRLVISSLGSSYRLSIIAFSACSKRLLPLRRMTAQGQRSTRRIIDLLVAGQGTSVGEALRKAAEVLEDRWERNPVASIMLLSDSQDERVSRANSEDRRCSKPQVSWTRFSLITDGSLSVIIVKNRGRAKFLSTFEGTGENAECEDPGKLKLRTVTYALQTAKIEKIRVEDSVLQKNKQREN
ncbi:E3 ubiquitin-protein ligase WAV3-like, partial [Macadamia integrifolia]|uniref:E3 ubiquitin-protein ligase WAV3-like n=1 Tax=Macadamia integrifolia TaxID=60698 RepID=UPI001C4EBC02